MATTGFWPIKGDLKGVVDYARNPEKTTMPDELRKAIDYAGNPDKTERMMFVSALNCPKQRAYERIPKRNIASSHVFRMFIWNPLPAQFFLRSQHFMKVKKSRNNDTFYS